MTRRAPTQQEIIGILWYNRLTPRQRAYWHRMADSPVPADAFRAYQEGKHGTS